MLSMARFIRKGGGFLFLALTSVATAHDLPASSPLQFNPPQPGSYTLHKIMRTPDGMVLDIDGKPKRLSRFTTGKITLLSFIYTTCTDAKGCPFAYYVLHQLKQQIQETPGLENQVRLASLSFDPQHDTPQVMRQYGGSHAVNGSGLEWNFLTTRSPKELVPLLEGFGQDVAVATDSEAGATIRNLSHVLKVFLIDKKGHVREIYTTSFLVPQAVMNDIKTLLLEDQTKQGGRE